MIVVAHTWCSKCDCYWPRATGWDDEDERYMCVPREAPPITFNRTHRPNLCDACRQGWCHLDTRLRHPDRSTVTTAWLEKKARGFFLSLTANEMRGMSLKQWYELHADPEGYVGRLDGCVWASYN